MRFWSTHCHSTISSRLALAKERLDGCFWFSTDFYFSRPCSSSVIINTCRQGGGQGRKRVFIATREYRFGRDFCVPDRGRDSSLRLLGLLYGILNVLKFGIFWTWISVYSVQTFTLPPFITFTHGITKLEAELVYLVVGDGIHEVLQHILQVRMHAGLVLSWCTSPGTFCPENPRRTLCLFVFLSNLNYGIPDGAFCKQNIGVFRNMISNHSIAPELNQRRKPSTSPHSPSLKISSWQNIFGLKPTFIYLFELLPRFERWFVGFSKISVW